MFSVYHSLGLGHETMYPLYVFLYSYVTEYMKRMETLGSHVMQSTRSNINKCYKWKSYTHIL